MVKSSKSKKMYAVEWCDVMENYSNYEIFSTLSKALCFAETLKTWEKPHIPLYLFTALFNTERIFIEDGVWNYDDYSDTIISKKIVLFEFNEPRDKDFEIKEELWKRIEKLRNDEEIKSLFYYPKNNIKTKKEILRIEANSLQSSYSV